MNLNAWKRFGVICSGLWLIVSGFFTALAVLFTQLAPDPGYVRLKNDLPEIISCYVLFGLAPVIGFAVLMKRQGHPLGIVEWIGLGICTALPFLYFLLLLKSDG